MERFQHRSPSWPIRHHNEELHGEVWEGRNTGCSKALLCNVGRGWRNDRRYCWCYSKGGIILAHVFIFEVMNGLYPLRKVNNEITPLLYSHPIMVNWQWNIGSITKWVFTKAAPEFHLSFRDPISERVLKLKHQQHYSIYTQHCWTRHTCLTRLNLTGSDWTVQHHHHQIAQSFHTTTVNIWIRAHLWFTVRMWSWFITQLRNCQCQFNSIYQY